MALRAILVPRALRFDEVARMFSVSSTTVRRWIASGSLAVVELPPGRQGVPIVRVPVSEVERLLKGKSDAAK